LLGEKKSVQEGEGRGLWQGAGKGNPEDIGIVLTPAVVLGRGEWSRKSLNGKKRKFQWGERMKLGKGRDSLKRSRVKGREGRSACDCVAERKGVSERGRVGRTSKAQVWRGKKKISKEKKERKESLSGGDGITIHFWRAETGGNLRGGGGTERKKKVSGNIPGGGRGSVS